MKEYCSPDRIDILSKIFKDVGFANLDNEVLKELVSYIQLFIGKSIFLVLLNFQIQRTTQKRKTTFYSNNLLIPN